MALPGIVAWWPLSEVSGTAADNALGAASLDGVYFNSPTLANYALPNGAALSPLFNGVNQGVNVYSAAIASAFSGAKGWFLAWYRDTQPGTANSSDKVIYLGADASNYVFIEKDDANEYHFIRRAGGTQTYLYQFGSSPRWHLMAMSWDQGTNELRAWFDAARLGTVSSIGTWSGTLASTLCCIAAGDSSGTLSMVGNVAEVALGAGEVLTDQLVSDLWDAMVSASYGITFGGDSKTAGDAWPNMLAGALAIETGNVWREFPYRYAVAGYTVAQLHTMIDANVPTAVGEPGIVCINIGANDAGALPAEATWKANLVGCISGLRSRWPEIQIYVARIWMRSQPANCATINGWINDIIALYDYVFAGPDESVWLENGDDGATYTSDGTHYSAAGQVEAVLQWMTALGY